MAQVLRRYAIAGALSEERGDRALEHLGDLPLERYPHTLLLERIWELRHNQGGSDVDPRMWQQLAPIAQALELKLVKIDVANLASLSAAFDMALREKANALFVLPDEPMFFNGRRSIVELAARHRLPAFYGVREFVDDGGLMSYGENLRVAYRKVASYVRKMARGATAGNLPVEQPTTFEFAINLKTAKALGITIPQSLRVRADHLIH